MPPMTPVTSILIVDDEPAIRNIMARWVTALGMEPKTAANADEALATMRAHHYDLAVIDVMMPGRDGLWLAAQLERDHPHTAVVIATAYTDLLDGGAANRPIADLLVKPFQRERFTLAVDRGRQWRKEALDGLRWHAMLSMELGDLTATICEEVRLRTEAGMSDLDALNASTAERAPETMLHSERVCRYAQSVARALGMNDDDTRLLGIAARFHDVGKMAMPDAILIKPSPLTPGEAAIMRRHVDIGAAIVASTESLRDAAPLVLASHEWFDGGGYPQKLAGEAIPTASRIIAVVDAYDAMTQDRHYRSRLDSKDAIGELLRCCPTQFDPAIVAVFLDILSRQ
jgi:putative two-component system response regulator